MSNILKALKHVVLYRNKSILKNEKASSNRVNQQGELLESWVKDMFSGVVASTTKQEKKRIVC